MSRIVHSSLRPIAAAGLCLAAVALFADPPAGSTPPSDSVDGESAETQKDELLTIEEARGRAKILQRTYISALETMHRRYFDADEKQMIPARALEDVFKEVDEGTHRTTRWISVNSPAMNVDHEPQPGFETDAVQALTDGKAEFERVEDGVYHRAGAVALTAGCLKCHVSSLTRQVSKQRVAGLVITMPVKTE